MSFIPNFPFKTKRFKKKMSPLHDDDDDDDNHDVDDNNDVDDDDGDDLKSIC